MRTPIRLAMTSTTRTATRIGALDAAAALSLTLTACGGNDTASMDHSSMSSESSSPTTSPSPSTGASSEAVEAEHNDQDVMFAQMMLVHHQGAVTMADQAITKASSQQVKDLASTIKAAQEPEIQQMTTWLEAWGEPTKANSSMDGMQGDSMEGMDHSSMTGMMTEEQITQLQNATGADLDQMFLQMMIEHHKGAVTMAETEQQQGQNTDALELSDSIVVSQNAEIEQMRQMLTAMS